VTGYLWRTDLLRSEKYWTDWFSGLSSLFLESTCPRLLILATWDRIDTTLMKGQMEGKFEVQIVYG
jgi:protein phosphatase methylesterase 1